MIDIKTNVLGFPRIGEERELKKACEAFWAGKICKKELLEEGKKIRLTNWTKMKEQGIDLIPSNDYSFYDHVLDMILTLGAIPERYLPLAKDKMELYFAMARGEQHDGKDFTAMEMTKWFDTNYHYIVPEFTRTQYFSLYDTKPVDEFLEAKKSGIITKPVLLGPISFLLLGKEKEPGFKRIDLLDRLLPAYLQLLKKLEKAGAEWIQIDEPCLVLDIDENTNIAYKHAFNEIRKHTNLKILLTTYFGGLEDNVSLALSLPVNGLHIDLTRAPEQTENIINSIPENIILSLGIIDGRNIWENDFDKSLSTINKAIETLGRERIFIGGSCSFLHVPYDLKLETDENKLSQSIKRWLSFAIQKNEELAILKDLSSEKPSKKALNKLEENRNDISERRTSSLIHDNKVKKRTSTITDKDKQRKSVFNERCKIQHKELDLPLFPTTTIGSFPQTKEIRSWRSKYKKGEISTEEYKNLLRKETKHCIEWQENIGLDVLVHGEFERNDMVEYFGEHLEGFAFTQNGWVQSYGSRCVKPPIIFGDVSRPKAITVDWTVYAQSLTKKQMKGMLTGPVTILEWSFVRNDQPRKDTCLQIALAIRDEVMSLEKAGIRIIQIDEPAIREGLPLRHSKWNEYLRWAIDCFRVTTSQVKDGTQIHTHMCYSEFNDIMEHIARMDADVITIECSRSQMELLDVFRSFKYPNEIGPGVYDIHSARVPSSSEMITLLHKATKLIDYHKIWINPDCGLKTRGWDETKTSLLNMIEAAHTIRKEY